MVMLACMAVNPRMSIWQGLWLEQEVGDRSPQEGADRWHAWDARIHSRWHNIEHACGWIPWSSTR
jgi:hypothetical protein